MDALIIATTLAASAGIAVVIERFTLTALFKALQRESAGRRPLKS
jgi:hypothetical protein